MTGGMAFIYDLNNNFENRVNPETVVWQKPETKYWVNYLKNLIEDHCKETNSNLSQKIIDNFDKEIYSFIQVCPKEMINKLENPITDKINIKEVS
jgi:glutamate synthase (NADPH/NADH) large chain